MKAKILNAKENITADYTIFYGVNYITYDIPQLVMYCNTLNYNGKSKEMSMVIKTPTNPETICKLNRIDKLSFFERKEAVESIFEEEILVTLKKSKLEILQKYVENN
jgi:hypothetical protein